MRRGSFDGSGQLCPEEESYEAGNEQYVEGNQGCVTAVGVEEEDEGCEEA